MADSDDSALSGTLADEEAAMHKGRGRSLIGMAALGLAVIGGLAFLMGGDDEARVYGELGKQINGLARGGFNQFWGCALQGENIADLRTNTEVMTKVDGRGMERGRSYGVHLRDTCMPLLQEVSPKLDVLIVPDDLAVDVKALSAATGALRSAFSGYIAYLDNPELEYDQEEAKPHLQAIARGWYEFKKAHGAANKTIKEKLQ